MILLQARLKLLIVVLIRQTRAFFGGETQKLDDVFGIFDQNQLF